MPGVRALRCQGWTGLHAALTCADLASCTRMLHPQGLEEYTSLLQRCWAQLPLERPSFDQIAAELRCVQCGVCFKIHSCVRASCTLHLCSRSTRPHSGPCRSLLDRTMLEMGTLSMLSSGSR